jgi:hypothetical protein
VFTRPTIDQIPFFFFSFSVVFSAPPEQAGGVVVTCADGTTIRADRAVVCAGASPKNPFQDVENERLKGIWRQGLKLIDLYVNI